MGCSPPAAGLGTTSETKPPQVSPRCGAPLQQPGPVHRLHLLNIRGPVRRRGPRCSGCASVVQGKAAARGRRTRGYIYRRGWRDGLRSFCAACSAPVVTVSGVVVDGGDEEPDRGGLLQEAKLQELWQGIPQQFIDDLMDSMPRRLEAVILNGGGVTTYYTCSPILQLSEYDFYMHVGALLGEPRLSEDTMSAAASKKVGHLAPPRLCRCRNIGPDAGRHHHNRPLGT